MKNSMLWGADISSLAELEENGAVFYQNGQPEDCLAILRAHGFTAIRLRVWNNPQRGFCSPEKTLAMAKRLQQQGFRFLLDFHYSDDWADPGKQYKPQAWSTLSVQELEAALYQFTYDLLNRMQIQGTPPDLVQIGNEITYGMLWEEGKVGGDFNTDEQWTQFSQFVSAGIRAVRDSLTKHTPVVLHIDRGADNQGSRYFLDRMLQCKVQFDAIGLSYYPWWHGEIEAFKQNFYDLAHRYQRDIYLLETSYPWQDTSVIRSQATPDPIVIPSIQPSVQEQTAFLQQVIEIVKNTPHQRGKGVFYWEPAWIPVHGEVHEWNKLALFDVTGQPLSSLQVFQEQPQLAD